MSKVAAVIIGDELLSGQFADENGPWLIRRLRELGSSLIRLTLVPDDRAAISDEVARTASLADRVVTSGGIGPTHDDITVDAVGAAFGLASEVRADLLERFEAYGVVIDAATRRMATVPVGSEISFAGRLPILTVRNVVVLPGVPSLFRLGFDAVASTFAGESSWTMRLWTPIAEHRFAEALTKAVARFPAVKIGSYPRFEEGRVLITLCGRSENAVREASAVVARVVGAVSSEGPERA